MTATGTALLHDLPLLVVGDLVLEVAPPRDRKTIEIVVERDASLVLKAPPAVTIDRATRFVTDKRQWVYRKLAEKDALCGPPVVKRFVEGEGFAYLGRSYRLTLTPEGTGVRLDRGRFHLPRSEADEGTAAMRSWYTKVGSKWLRKRIRPWAARLGEQTVEIAVRDLGFRWGSARPTDGPQRINIHWATLRLTRFGGHSKAWDDVSRKECSDMPKTRAPYAAEFREEMVRLVRAGRTPGELSRVVRTVRADDP